MDFLNNLKEQSLLIIPNNLKTKVLEEINNLGTTIIMATHDKEMVNRMKKRVILIEAGKLKEDYEKGTYNHEAA